MSDYEATDFVSGNHVTPYALIARGKPIVCLASPSNSVNDKLVSRKPACSPSELSGRRIGDTIRFKEAKFPPVNKVSGELMSKITARWQE